MSNPSLLVALFEESLAYTDQAGSGAFTGVDPIRYDDGLWLAAGATNYHKNPRIASTSGFTGFSISGSGVMSRDTGFGFGTSDAIKFVSGQGSVPYEVVWWDTTAIATSIGQTWTFSVYLEGSGNVRVGLTERNAAGSAFEDSYSSTIALTGTPVRHSITVTIDQVDNGSIYPQVSCADTNPCTFYASAWQVEPGPVATDYFDYSMGPGYSGSEGTVSVRAASSASVATADHIEPAAGSFALQLTRVIDTGTEGIYFEAGTVGSGTDALRGGIDASDHPFVEWNSNNAGWERLTSTATVTTGTEFVYLTDWTGTVTRLQVDDAAIESGTRDTVQGDWGAGTLTLEAA